MATTPTRPKFELKMGKATREAYGEALAELGRKNPNVIALDADLAKQALLNIMINGLQAMPHGGRLSISVSARDNDAHRAGVIRSAG